MRVGSDTCSGSPRSLDGADGGRSKRAGRFRSHEVARADAPARGSLARLQTHRHKHIHQRRHRGVARQLRRRRVARDLLQRRCVQRRLCARHQRRRRLQRRLHATSLVNRHPPPPHTVSNSRVRHQPENLLLLPPPEDGAKRDMCSSPSVPRGCLSPHPQRDMRSCAHATTAPQIPAWPPTPAADAHACTASARRTGRFVPTAGYTPPPTPRACTEQPHQLVRKGIGVGTSGL